jgi:branched-chain amino acid aminotransferase
MWLASVDGVVSPVEEARIPVSDEGLLRGDGGFEVIRLYGGIPYGWDDHLTRLGHTCAGLRLDADLAALGEETRRLLARAGDLDGLVRLVVTRGGRRLAILEPLPDYGGTATRVATVTYAPTRVLNGLKTLSYAANMLATRVAREGGADEALLVTPHGRVLEGPTWTFLWVEADGVLCTPPLSEGILDSITRRRLLEECAVQEATCTLARLADAREAVIASTTREIAPIASVDDIVLPEAPGPVTTAAALAFRARVDRDLAGARAAV